MNVLLVEDEKRIRETVKKALQRIVPGVICLEAENPREAIRDLTDNTVDVVVLDLEMPEGNGTDVLKHLLKEEERTERKPLVIVFTNHTAAAYRNNCLRLGAHHFLDKTFDFDRLLDIIRGESARGISAGRCSNIPT